MTGVFAINTIPAWVVRNWKGNTKPEIFGDRLMKYDPAQHHRRSIRLKGYDYTSPGAYFITICTVNRECLFGEIIEDVVHLNLLGLCFNPVGKICLATFSM
jgi:hypothetical protein